MTRMENLQDEIREIRGQLRRAMNGVTSTSMREKGIVYKLNFGVSYPDIKEIAVEPTLVRELLDEYGFTETELHLNEWHYWVGGFSKPAYLDMVNGLPGINAAVFATAVISARPLAAKASDAPRSRSCPLAVLTS